MYWLFDMNPPQSHPPDPLSAIIALWPGKLASVDCITCGLTPSDSRLDLANGRHWQEICKWEAVQARACFSPLPPCSASKACGLSWQQPLFMTTEAFPWLQVSPGFHDVISFPAQAASFDVSPSCPNILHCLPNVVQTLKEVILLQSLILFLTGTLKYTGYILIPFLLF